MLATPIEVKKALKEGTHKKNYRFVVLNDDGTEDFTIDNDTLVAESVHIDERMATGSELKFGLCEGSSLEFQYFDYPNITGRRVQVFVDVEYEGFEDVQEMTLSFVYSSNYRTAPYLFQDAEYYRLYGTDASLSYVHLYNPDNNNRDINFETQDDGSKVAVIGDLINDYTGFYAVSTVANIKVMLQKKGRAWYSIPLGFFDVKSCSRQASTGIYKATAYNKLQSDYLDAKANDLISEMQSDIDDPNKITVSTVQSMLLSDYEIETKEVVTVTPVFDQSERDVIMSTPTFKVNGTTYYPYMEFSYLEYTVNYTKKTELLFDEYLSKLKNALDDMHTAFSNTITNPDTFWNNFINSLFYQIRGGITVNFYGVLDDATYVLYADDITTWRESIHGDIEKLKYLYGAMSVTFRLPYSFYGSTSSSQVSNPLLIWQSAVRLSTDDVTVNQITVDSIDTITIDKTNLPDVTLRELISANYSLRAQFGQLDRVTDLFSGVELNGGGLYPAETLYPADSLYPNSNTGGQGIHPYPSEYSQLWTDTMGEQSFRYLIITYKTLDENNNEVDAVLQKTVNADGTTDYNMSDNWLFRNLVWTAADVEAYAETMKAKMQNIRWFPFEMWAAGLPYVETGDAIEITDREGNTHNSYILQRQLQGIQNLQDTYVNGELDIF